MKIGILTLPLHINYGGILQAYALQTVLERMGHQVYIFNLQKQNKKRVSKIQYCIKQSKLLIKRFLHKRDIRSYEYDTVRQCEIKPFIMVNHWGTIICKEPIELDTKWNSKFVDKGDYCYLGDTAKLDEYLNTDYSEEQSEGLEMR